MWCKTRSARLRRTVKSIADWCRGNRHKPVKVQHEALCRRIQGTTITSASAATFVVCLLVQQEVRRAWFKWLRRRSQRNASELGEVFGTTQAFPSSASQYSCPNLGRLATSRTDGGAQNGGNLLVRIWRGPGAGDRSWLLYSATLRRRRLPAQSCRRRYCWIQAPNPVDERWFGVALIPVRKLAHVPRGRPSHGLARGQGRVSALGFDLDELAPAIDVDGNLALARCVRCRRDVGVFLDQDVAARGDVRDPAFLAIGDQAPQRR